MEKEVIWTDSAKADLQEAYEFNTGLMGEEKAFELVEKLIRKADLLYNPNPGGTRYIAKKLPKSTIKNLLKVILSSFTGKKGTKCI